MRRFHSHATSPGIVIGRAYRLDNRGSAFARTWIRDADIEEEVLRFRNSVQKAKEQLSHIQAKMCRYSGHDQIKIIESYRMFLQDDMLVATTIQHIEQHRINAEWALDKTLAQLKLSFLNVDEEYFRERQQDIDYVGRRLMDNLIGSPDVSFNEIPRGDAIIIVHDLSPAEVASIPKDRIKGFVMEAGGETSHSAIISRALEIPAMFGIHGIFEEIDEGEMLILDGIKGVLVASPSKKELEQYRAIQKRYQALEQILLDEIDLPAETKDGFRINIEANMELVEEIPSLLEHGAEGIGLYRTEYLFLNRLDEPSEEEQYENYVTVLKQLGNRPVTIRTIDLGGDKLAISQTYEAPQNPALGLRAIRLCLRELPLFKTQLRALLRASVHGNLKILLPMISSMEELRQVRKIIKDVKRDLTTKNVEFNEDVPVGIMIEVPSAVFLAKELARECDFFSIGTNDLIQYGLAIDRGNEQVAHLYNPYSPAILRMIKQTVDAAKAAKIGISICGELAGDPLAITLMVGLGLGSLSMNPISISRVKKLLRSITREQSVKILKEAISLDTAEEIEKLLKRKTSHLLPGDVRKLHIIEGQTPPE
jgi:phosphotransferase system enzyme I (PtsI)